MQPGGRKNSVFPRGAWRAGRACRAGWPGGLAASWPRAGQGVLRHPGTSGDPAGMAARATRYLNDEAELLLADLVVAETICVLESFDEAPRDQVADAMRSLLAMQSVVTVDAALLLRAIEIYETYRLDFAEAYLVACAESTGINTVASFDRSIDRVPTVARIEPRDH